MSIRVSYTVQEERTQYTVHSDVVVPINYFVVTEGTVQL